MAKGKYNARKRKVKKNVPAGVVHIESTFNNINIFIGNKNELNPIITSIKIII